MKRILLVTAGAVLLLSPGRALAQPAPAAAPPTTADVQVVSAEIQRFPKPIQTAAASAGYDQALVLRLRADKKTVDSFPPSMQPFLYIGREEYRIFQEDRNDDRPDLILTVHVPGWDRIPEGAPMVLTILHGAPDRLVRPGTSRFSRKFIVDKR